MRIELTVNSETKYFRTSPDEKLLELLRRYGYMSVKKGCGEGTCGACTVIMDGSLVNSCLVFAPMAAGRSIVTVEGLGTVNDPHPYQEEFVKAGAVQCGFCTPGMILAVKSLLDQNPDPTDLDIRQALDGNLCRCTGYVKILDAVKNIIAREHEEARGGKA
jgi:carbon-monoxide dehydrogenase small subunit